MIESIKPTAPADAMIFVSCDGPVIEMQVDDLADLVNLQLDEQQALKLIRALQSAVQELRKAVQP